MYPLQILSLFPAFPRDDRVFVAMSFEARFEARWTNVLEPAIRSANIDGRPLVPFRVDARRVSDSILTEIVVAIATTTYGKQKSFRIAPFHFALPFACASHCITNGSRSFAHGITHGIRILKAARVDPVLLT
jgi:hypothetical protein